MTRSLKNIMPELTVSVQINTWVCGGASVELVQAENKRQLCQQDQIWK